MSQSDEYRREATTTRITQPTHDRIHEHNRASETLSATIARALDALEREEEFPAAVREVLRDDA